MKYWNYCGLQYYLSLDMLYLYQMVVLHFLLLWSVLMNLKFLLSVGSGFSCCSSPGFFCKSAGWLCPSVCCGIVSEAARWYFVTWCIFLIGANFCLGFSVLRMWLVDFSDCFRNGLVGHWTCYCKFKKVSIWWMICPVSSNLENEI